MSPVSPTERAAVGTNEIDDPFRPELYDAIDAGYYDRVYQRGRGVQWFWHHHRFAQVANALPGNARRLVDLGCGPGTFLGNLTRSYDRALGIDIAVPQIEYARSRYRAPGLEFRVGDVAALRASVDRFDAAISIEVIEHLRPDDTQAFLASMLDLLEPGGTLLLATPNSRSLWPLLEYAVSVIGPVDYRRQHINMFDRHRLLAVARAAGFVDCRVSTFFVVAPFVAAGSRWLAERVLRWERVAPNLGAELLLTARRPG